MKYVLWIVFILVLLIVLIPFCIVKLCSNPIQEHKGSVSNYHVKVYLEEKKQVSEVDLEEYVKGVVSSEMPGEFEVEALKAQAVAARTYALSRMEKFNQSGQPDHPKAPLCDTIHCQVYRSKADLETIKSSEWMSKYWRKISQAVEDTNGLVMTYNGKLVDQPLFHSSSGGKTENSEDVFSAWVPYLRSVDSPYEQNAPHNNEKVEVTVNEMATQLKKRYTGYSINKSTVKDIQIMARSSGGRVERVRIGKLTITGRDIREILNLRSANFKVQISGNKIIFTTIGYGHGVGMSQWGANGMAQNGSNYKEILKHYYQGIEIKKY